MAVIYRTAGAWGAGKGSRLTPAEVDNNFWEIVGRVLALETTPVPPNSIDTIEVVGGQMTIILTDATELGPFTLPVAIMNPRGEFAAVAYDLLDLITVTSAGADNGLYMSLQAHTGVLPFDKTRQIGGEDVYQLVLPPGPTGAVGPEGPEGPIGPQGFNFNVSATGTFAQRDAFDDEVQGFSYLSTNGDNGATTFLASIFIKESAASADWSDPIPFQGPEGDIGPTGPAGPAGPTGPAGPGGNYLGAYNLGSQPAANAGNKGKTAFINDVLGGIMVECDGSHWVVGAETFVVPLSDETTDITTGAAKFSLRLPFKCKTGQLPRAHLTTASSSGAPAFDINKNGTTLFSTALTIDASETDSLTAATPAVLTTTPTEFADGDLVTFDIDTAGTGAKGAKAVLYLKRIL